MISVGLLLIGCSLATFDYDYFVLRKNYTGMKPEEVEKEPSQRRAVLLISELMTTRLEMQNLPYDQLRNAKEEKPNVGWPFILTWLAFVMACIVLVFVIVGIVCFPSSEAKPKRRRRR